MKYTGVLVTIAEYSGTMKQHTDRGIYGEEKMRQLQLAHYQQ
ncbi:hypothetical protein NIES4101_54100 [Calothrix sp. NIES-4101]|nr:hypothetical protein NIES4101_54100 [Calothrix sp. NIES-4101]